MKWISPLKFIKNDFVNVEMSSKSSTETCVQEFNSKSNTRLSKMSSFSAMTTMKLKSRYFLKIRYHQGAISISSTYVLKLLLKITEHFNSRGLIL